MKQDFTTKGSYHGDNDFIFHCDDCRVNSRRTELPLQSDLPIWLASAAPSRMTLHKTFLANVELR